MCSSDLGMASGSTLKLRSTRVPVAGQQASFVLENTSGFGWIEIYPAPSPTPSLVLGPGLLCSTGTIYGLGGVLADAMGVPGTLSFNLPASMSGQGFVAQGIGFDFNGNCLQLSDPLVLTIR